MRKLISIFMVLCLIALSCSEKTFDSGTGDNPSQDDSHSNDETTLAITWDKTTEKTFSAGGYPRIHRLNDGRLAIVFQKGGGSCLAFSSDNGITWTTPTTPWPNYTENNAKGSASIIIANPEFAQLSSSSPTHPDRIIFSANLRPQNEKSTVQPYAIAISTSDDYGKNWTSLKIVYSSDPWSVDTGKGCWEPFVLELPDGTVQIYFSDETPYWKNGYHFQNISFIESTDGGETWGPVRIAAYTTYFRDGMPSVMIYESNLYLAIEHNEFGKLLHPQIVRNPLSENWMTTVSELSSYRFSPFQTPFDAANIYGGAPYLIHTDNYFVLSYQSSKGSSVATDEHSVMEVVACPINEMSEEIFTTMRGASRPFTIDQSTGKALWNGMCDLGNDWVLACSATDSGVRLCRGKITGSK